MAALIFALFFFCFQPQVDAYSETIQVPVNSLAFNFRFDPAGTALSQLMGFDNYDPIRHNSSNRLSNGIEVYASASVPTGGGARPNAKSSGWFTYSGSFPLKASYLQWSAVGNQITFYSQHAPPSEMGAIAYGYATSGTHILGSYSYSISGPSVWVSADYWYPNSEYITDCSEVRLRLTFSYLAITSHRTETTIGASQASGNAPLIVSFSASVKDGVGPYSYSWNFGGIGTSSQQNPSFVFSSPGSYNVTCTATDSVNVSDTKWILVTVFSVFLTVEKDGSGTTSPVPGIHPEPKDGQISVTATPSSGYILDKWQLDGIDCGDANPFIVTMNKNHTLKAFFIKSLIVNAWASPTSGLNPLTVSFYCGVSGGSAPYSFSWSFGDGMSSSQQNITHIYRSSGSYTATITAMDSANRTCLSSVGPIIVDNVAFSLSKSGDINLTAGMTGSSIISAISTQARSVTLSMQWIGNSPAYSTASLSRISGITDFTSTFILNSTTATPPGKYTCRVIGSSNGVVKFIDILIAVGEVQYDLIVQADAGGTTSPAPSSYVYASGMEASVIAIADPGYLFNGWLLDGVPYTAPNPATIFMDKDHAIVAIFEPNSIESNSIVVQPCDIETGDVFKQVIIGEYISINITGKLEGVSSPTAIAINGWLDPSGSMIWDAVSEHLSNGTLKLMATATTDASGWFTVKLGDIGEQCWVARDAADGSPFLAYAEITSGNNTHLYSDSWKIGNVRVGVDFDYNITGVIVYFHLTFNDGTIVKNRQGSFLASFKEVDVGMSDQCDASGIMQLWIPYSKLERLPYRETNWTVVTYAYCNGSTSAMTWFTPSIIRFTELGAQFLIHNDTHLALEAFDWGSPSHQDLSGVTAYLWWDDVYPWDGKTGILPGSPFGPSSPSILVSNQDGRYLLGINGELWLISELVEIPASIQSINSVIFIIHQNITATLADPYGPSALYLRLIPPHTTGVLFSPARASTMLLAASIRSGDGW